MGVLLASPRAAQQMNSGVEIALASSDYVGLLIVQTQGYVKGEVKSAGRVVSAESRDIYRH